MKYLNNITKLSHSCKPKHLNASSIILNKVWWKIEYSYNWEAQQDIKIIIKRAFIN